MKGNAILLLIVVFNLLTRFWKIGEIPALLRQQDTSLRLFSALISVIIPVFLYFFISKIYKSKKLALLTSLVFSILPQSIIEGRIVAVYIYPQIELSANLSFFKFITNFLSLTSFDMFFFQNLTFYFGGVKETGMLYMAMIPFFFTGVYYSIVENKIKPLLIILAVLVIVSLSQTFPENRLLYLSYPFLSLLVGKGMIETWKKNRYKKAFILIMLCILVYETFQFFHFYTVHYPGQVREFREKIKKPF